MDLQHATESTAAKISSRIVTPTLVFVLTITLGIIGYLVKRAWDENTHQLEKIGEQLGTQSEKTSTLDKKFDLMAQRVDTMLIRQVEQNTKRLDGHEERIQKLERSVRTP